MALTEESKRRIEKARERRIEEKRRLAKRTAYPTVRRHMRIDVIEHDLTTLKSDVDMIKKRFGHTPVATKGRPGRPRKHTAGGFAEPSAPTNESTAIVSDTLPKLARAREDVALMPVHASFESFEVARKEWLEQRITEVARAHGGTISSGVGAILVAASQAWASSQFAYARGAEHGSLEHFRVSSNLAQVAAGHEHRAWDLAAAECKATPKVTDVPWLVASTEDDGGDDVSP
jgi:hypothetical protein